MLQRSTFPLLLLVVVVLSTSPAALAQTSAHGHWITDPKNVATPGFVFDVPPSDFNPLAASDADLRAWGFPPRPDASKYEAYDLWTRMVTAKRVTPQLIFTNIYHGPARNVRVGMVRANTTAAQSDNWSGYAITQEPGTFYSKNSTYVMAKWTIPSVSPPSGPVAAQPPTTPHSGLASMAGAARAMYCRAESRPIVATPTTHGTNGSLTPKRYLVRHCRRWRLRIRRNHIRYGDPARKLLYMERDNRSGHSGFVYPLRA